MWEVLAGFSVVWLIIGVGYLVGRTGLLGPESPMVLSRISFFIASPCLLFTTISETPIADSLGPQFAVAGLSALISLAVFLTLTPIFLRGRPNSEYVVAGHSASQVNAANLGFPIAAYVLGDVALAAPVVVFQLAIYMPILVGTLDQLTLRRAKASSLGEHMFWPTVRRIGRTLATPVIIGSTLGLLFAWKNWHLVGPIREVVQLLAGAAIPVMLLTFGLSLVGNAPLSKVAGRRSDVILATVIKLIVHPVAAYFVGAYAFGLEGTLLYSTVVMAALPTAQNILVTAIRYETGETIVRDTVLLTTVLAIPSMVAIALLLA